MPVAEQHKSTKPVDGKTPVSGLPASQRVTAPACPLCRSVETGIYRTVRPTRYCKCETCGGTWTFAVAAEIEPNRW